MPRTSAKRPQQHEDLLARGAEAYAIIEYAAYSIDRVSIGGGWTPRNFARFGEELLAQFQKELKKLGRGNRVRVRQLYKPATPPVSQTSDPGP
ncbi:MAG: hypothetical protein V1849_04675 [Chloroflexota bacterium]